jgi:Restriction endonuclease
VQNQLRIVLSRSILLSRVAWLPFGAWADILNNVSKNDGKKRSSATSLWKEFERAVNTLLKSLLKDDPNAKVRFDPPKTDRDTKRKQQVDCWIDYKVWGHIPITILVSCKDRGRAIDVGEIRTFIQEIADAGASTGAMYSRSGFTKDAVAKASTHGIGCFQLWRNRPADQPIIELYRKYWCWDSVCTPIVQPGDAGFPPKTWDEFFNFSIILGGNELSIGDHLEEALRRGKEQAIEEAKKIAKFEFPNDFLCTIDLADSPSRSTRILVGCRWLRYRSKLSASLLNGSFCVSTGEFVGTESMAFPVTYPPPASDWEFLPTNPEKDSSVKTFLFTKKSAGLIAELKKSLAGKAIPANGAANS